MLKIILRNLLRSLPRIRPVAAALALTFAALLVGNAVLSYSDAVFQTAYTKNLTGHMSLSAAAEQNFTLFGGEALLVGDFHVPPVLLDFEDLQAAVQAHPSVKHSSAVVTSAAQARIGNRNFPQVLFGVNFPLYTTMFSNIELLLGDFPDEAEPGILIQEQQFQRLSSQLGREPRIGEAVLLTVAYGISFTIREVPLAGVYRYPVDEEMLNAVALLDVATARALNGYVYGSKEADVPEAHGSLFDSNFDDLFSVAQTDDEADSSMEEGDILDPFASLGESPAQSFETQAGAYNFLLIELVNSRQQRALTRYLAQNGFSQDNGYLSRDWRRTVGGTVMLVWYLQMMLNTGLLFVALGAVIVVANTLMLSVLERRKEIGTMRALGASRLRVALMIGLETMAVVVGAALCGVLLGSLCVLLLNSQNLVLDNQYLLAAFGGGSIQGRLSWDLLAYHSAAAVFFAVLALLYPLKRTLKIHPAEAMR